MLSRRQFMKVCKLLWRYVEMNKHAIVPGKLHRFGLVYKEKDTKEMWGLALERLSNAALQEDAEDEDWVDVKATFKPTKEKDMAYR